MMAYTTIPLNRPYSYIPLLDWNYNLGQNTKEQLASFSPKAISEAQRSKNVPFWIHWNGGGVGQDVHLFCLRLLLITAANAGHLFKCKWHKTLYNEIPLPEPPLQTSSSPIPSISIWPIVIIGSDSLALLDRSSARRRKNEYTCFFALSFYHAQTLWVSMT